MSIAKRISVDVNMQSTGRRLMRTISYRHSLLHYVFPTEVLMTVKAHRVSYYLHTIIKRTVSLDVDMLIILIGDREYFISIIAVLACSVYLKLNSEESLGITVEYRLRLIPIVMDASVTINLVMIGVFRYIYLITDNLLSTNLIFKLPFMLSSMKLLYDASFP